MEKLNIGTRVEMFSICASIEYDLKAFILSSTSKIEFTDVMKNKANERSKDIKNDEDILNQLDLGDYVQLIISNPFEYGINNEKANMLSRYFDRIIPVRNRVMHTKPLEIGDRALLIEVMQDIFRSIPWIDWRELKNTKSIIENDCSQLLSRKYVGIKEYNPSVYHNLPLPEFDDTGFVGRKRDIKEITELLLNKKSQVISVVGNGGMGKTSTVVKLLYDLIEKPENPFEAIIWITLKTKTLSNGEFVEICDSLQSVTDIINKGNEIVNTDNQMEPMDAIIEFMSVFNVLLVLDNLETVNAGEINDFIRKIPDNSKVLITSRLGIGEFEVRQRIDGMEKNDAITYYRELSKYYGLSLHKQSDTEIYTKIHNNLYDNPLSIKWFISGIYSGTSEKLMLGHKQDLIEFCISNIYDKLSATSRKILQLFLLEKSRLTYGSIDFYIEETDVEIKNSINELLTTYMIHASSGVYVMNEMSRDYIATQYPPSNEFTKEIFAKRKSLMAMLQSVKVQSEQAPFNPNTISSKINDTDKQLATYYLKEALSFGKEKKWDECTQALNKATNIEPDFFEVYKIRGFLDAERGELFGAINNYEIALTKCTNNRERAIVCFLFSVFYTVKMQDVESGLEYINKADEYLPDSNDIMLEKVRVYTYIGKYEEAELMWNVVREREDHPNMRTMNIMANRFIDLKRRQAGLLQTRDFIEKYNILKQGIDMLNDVSMIDDKTAVTLLKTLSDLSYLYFYDPALVLLAETLEKYAEAISKLDTKNKNKILENMQMHQSDISSGLFKRICEKVATYKSETKSFTNDNEGVVVKLKDNYGFIGNAKHSYKKGLFFTIKNAYEGIQVGDNVKFEIYDTPRGEAARNIEKM